MSMPWSSATSDTVIPTRPGTTALDPSWSTKVMCTVTSETWGAGAALAGVVLKKLARDRGRRGARRCGWPCGAEGSSERAGGHFLGLSPALQLGGVKLICIFSSPPLRARSKLGSKARLHAL